MKRVQKALSKSRALVQHAKVVKRFPRRKILNLPFYNLSVDLKDLSKLSPYNDNHKWILVAIDSGSRFMFAEPLKNKSAREVVNGLKRIFVTMKARGQPYPHSVITDEGKEFINKDLKSLLTEKGIENYYVKSKMKASLVERAIRTLSERLYKYFSLYNTFRYIDILPAMVEAYNNTYHTAIGMKPAEVTVHHGHDIFMRDLFKTRGTDSPPLKKGQHVFITKEKKLFIGPLSFTL